MQTMQRTLWSIFLIASICPTSVAWARYPSPLQATEQQPVLVDESQMPNGQVIQPAGLGVQFHGRPVDVQISPDGKQIFVKDRKALRIIDVETMKEIQSVPSPGGASLYGLAVTQHGDVLMTDAGQGLNVFAKTDDQKYDRTQTIELPQGSFPCGLALSEDHKLVYVCLSKKNSIGIVDLAKGEMIDQVEVGIAPFDCRLDQAGNLLVSNLGGKRASEDDKTATSAGTDVPVDRRGIAQAGSVSVVDLKARKLVRTIETGRHPSVLSAAADGKSVVCLTNEDAVQIISAEGALVDPVIVKPKQDIPFGSMPSCVIPLPGTTKHLVALAGNNAVAIVDLQQTDNPVLGLIPTAWYPVGLTTNESYLFVACVKGLGSRSRQRPVEKGRNSHDHLGTVHRVELASLGNPQQLEQWTAQAIENSRLPRISPAIERTADRDAAPIPVPKKLGQPSLFKHVIYVIKENRTYDQVFGDLPEARGEPELCVFPEKVTPNHHALAKRFGLLDNYYCNGVLSADGHSWATEGNVTPYLERAFGGFARSYTFGDDPLTYSSSGFIWDQILDAGLSFRNYGEMNYSKPPAGWKYQEVWEAYQAGKPIKFEHKIGIERLRRYSSLDYPGWNMVIPDVLRIDSFLKEFREFEKSGELPSLCILYLPQDHLGGGITSRSHMADNDQALGRLVEAVSGSRFWKDTVIFVNEDDPQNGYDHIDGHRSLCLVISPYSKPGVNHDFFNQTSVLRTMLHLFGLPPMNQQDAAAPLMSSCFQTTANLDPFRCLPTDIPLNESPQPKQEQSSLEQKWRRILATVPIERTGMKTEQDEENLNRFVWHEMKGWQTPYPQRWSGAHGSGFQRLRLKLEE